MDSQRVGDPDRPSAPSFVVIAGLGVAAASLVLAALTGSPYLGLDSLNPWLVGFALGLFGCLGAAPFAINEWITGSDPERTEAWERSMLIWGLVTLPAALLSGTLIFAGGFSPETSLVDAAAIVVLIEAGLIELSLVAWLLAG